MLLLYTSAIDEKQVKHVSSGKTSAGFLAAPLTDSLGEGGDQQLNNYWLMTAVERILQQAGGKASGTRGLSISKTMC